MSAIPRSSVVSRAVPQTITCGRPSTPGSHLDVGPRNAVASPGSNRLQDRFLGRPPAGEVLDRVFPRLAIADLTLGVNAAEKHFAVVLDHLADARALDDVGADSQYFHALAFPGELDATSRCLSLRHSSRRSRSPCQSRASPVLRPEATRARWSLAPLRCVLPTCYLVDPTYPCRYTVC